MEDIWPLTEIEAQERRTCRAEVAGGSEVRDGLETTLPADMARGGGRQYSVLSSLCQQKTSIESDQVALGGGTDSLRPNVSGTSLSGTFS